MVGCCPAAATSANLRPAKLLAVFFVIWRHLVAAREVSVNTNGNFFCVFLTGTSYPEPVVAWLCSKLIPRSARSAKDVDL